MHVPMFTKSRNVFILICFVSNGIHIMNERSIDVCVYTAHLQNISARALKLDILSTMLIDHEFDKISTV